MSIQKNLITLCFATVFTLGLAACGGGGGGGDAPVTDMTDMDGPDPRPRSRRSAVHRAAGGDQFRHRRGECRVGVVTDAADR